MGQLVKLSPEQIKELRALDEELDLVVEPETGEIKREANAPQQRPQDEARVPQRSNVRWD